MFTYEGALFYADIWRALTMKKCEAFLRWLCAMRKRRTLFYYIQRKSSLCGLLFHRGESILFYFIQNGVLFKIGKGCLRPLGEADRRQEVKGGVLLTSLVVYIRNMDKM